MFSRVGHTLIRVTFSEFESSTIQASSPHGLLSALWLAATAPHATGNGTGPIISIGFTCSSWDTAWLDFQFAPGGRPGMSDVSPLSGISGLSFDATLLSPPLFFCIVLLLFLSYLFFCLLAHSPELFPENSSVFFVKR